jgi:hypothetical protein
MFTKASAQRSAYGDWKLDATTRGCPQIGRMPPSSTQGLFAWLKIND